MNDPELMLVWIRNSFAEAEIFLPAFDLAFAIFWEATRGEQPAPVFTKQWLRRTTGVAQAGADQGASSAAEWLKSDDATEMLGDVVSELPGVGFVLKKIGSWAIKKSKKAYLEKTRKYLSELYVDGELKTSYEISRLLPWMIAQDLNLHLKENSNERFLLCFDEYEKVFDQGGAGVRWEDNLIDAHVRTLVQHTNGMLAVFFMRERLRWENEADWAEDLKDAHHLLSGIPADDADIFLKAIPIESANIREIMIYAARESSEPESKIYPLLIDLQVEHWRNLRSTGVVDESMIAVKSQTFEGRRREIVARILRDYGNVMQSTVEVVSLTRRLDYKAFAFLMNEAGLDKSFEQFEKLSRLSFINYIDNKYISMHSAVSEIIKSTINEHKFKHISSRMFEHFLERSKFVSYQDLNDEKISLLTEAAFFKRNYDIDGYASWLELALHPIFIGARYSVLVQIWQEAIEILENLFGKMHSGIALCYSSIGYVLQEQGNLRYAREVVEKALAIRVEIEGDSSINTAKSLDQLAYQFQLEGNVAVARQLKEQSHLIVEKIDKSDEYSIAVSLSNLTYLIQAQGEYELAKKNYEKVIFIFGRIPDCSPEVFAKALNNYGQVLRELRKYKESLRAHQGALIIRKRIFGESHPALAATLNDIAILLTEMNAPEDAKAYGFEALNIFIEHFGENHAYTATAYHNIGFIYEALNEFKKSEQNYQRALGIRIAQFGYDHPDIAITMHNLGLINHKQGNIVRAREYAVKSVMMRQKLLGVSHRDSVTSLVQLLKVLEEDRNSLEARIVLQRVNQIIDENRPALHSAGFFQF